MTTTLVRIEGRYSADEYCGLVMVNGRALTPERSLRLRRHSPSGFAWGYGGSGPSQLALAILLEAGVSETVALHHYQRFKEQFLAPLDAEGDFILEVDLATWLPLMTGE